MYPKNYLVTVIVGYTGNKLHNLFLYVEKNHRIRIIVFIDILYKTCLNGILWLFFFLKSLFIKPS